MGLQGPSVNVFDMQDKIHVMLKTISEKEFAIKVKAGDVSALESFLSDSDLAIDDGVRDNTQHPWAC